MSMWNPMHTLDTLDTILDLAGADTPVHPASDIKSGWSRIVENAVRHGEVIITHHRRPEAVVMDVAAYADLARRAEANSPLQALRADFDRRFAKLNTKSGTTRLRAQAAAGIPAPSSAKPARKARNTRR